MSFCLELVLKCTGSTLESIFGRIYIHSMKHILNSCDKLANLQKENMLWKLCKFSASLLFGRKAPEIAHKLNGLLGSTVVNLLIFTDYMVLCIFYDFDYKCQTKSKVASIVRKLNV